MNGGIKWVKGLYFRSHQCGQVHTGYSPAVMTVPRAIHEWSTLFTEHIFFFGRPLHNFHISLGSGCIIDYQHRGTPGRG